MLITTVCDSLWPHCLLVTFSHSKDRCGGTSESLWKPGIHVWEASFIIGMAELQLCLRQKVNSVSLGVVKGNLLAQNERGAARKRAGRGWHPGLHRTSLQSNQREFPSPKWGACAKDVVAQVTSEVVGKLKSWDTGRLLCFYKVWIRSCL